MTRIGANVFRYSLGVPDLSRSVAFYRALFACEPARVDADSADFELIDPPVLLTLLRQDRVAPTNAPALWLPDRAAVVALRDRWTRLGLKTHTQECTHCGYNEQFKVHVGDPDGHYWSVYFVERRIHPSAIHRCLEGPEAVLPPDPVSESWEPAPSEVLPKRIPHVNGSLDEVRLPSHSVEMAEEAFRTVRPGGTVRVEVTGELRTQAMDMLREAGFVGLEADGTTIRGFRPDDSTPAKTRLVLYKGPFREARDDLGNVYPRGRRVLVTEAAWTLLRRGAAAEQFLFLFPFGYPERGPIRPPASMFEEVGA